MTNSWLTFQPLFPFWIVAVLALPIFFFFIWKEIGRNQKFLVARIIAHLFILFSILGLFMRPSYREQKGGSAFILLTPGYNKSKVDSILKENTSLKILRTKETDPYPNSEVLTSYHNVSEVSADIKIIVGQGLPYYVLEEMDQKNFKFLPSLLPSGITELSIPKSIIVNKKNHVNGVFNSSGKTTLTLLGPAGVEDSILFRGFGEFSFDLSFKPRQSGLFVYTLAHHNATTTSVEKLPIEVRPEQKLKILILQKFPTAEIRYLKNYLAEKGHSLALRYQTSKTNYKYEYANLNSIKVNRLTSELAESFDLIFMDNTVLDELSTGEKSVLEKAIHSGLGAIILTDDFPEKGNPINRFLPIKTKRITKDTVHILFPDSKLNILPIVAVEIPRDASIHTILSHKGHILSGYIFSGAGKVGFQLLKETYRISLKGNADDYAFVWSDLIERTARAKNEMFKMNLVNDFPYYSDEPLFVNIISSGIQPLLYADKNFIPLMEDVIIDDYWQGKSWAGKRGWNQFSILQDSTHLNYFVSNDKEWRTLRIANQIRINELAEAEDSKEKIASLYIGKPIPAILFYVIFLLACGFLWLAPKL